MNIAGERLNGLDPGAFFLSGVSPGRISVRGGVSGIGRLFFFYILDFIFVKLVSAVLAHGAFVVHLVSASRTVLAALFPLAAGFGSNYVAAVTPGAWKFIPAVLADIPAGINHVLAARTALAPAPPASLFA